MSSTLKVRIPGKGEVVLTQSDYLATGGEGSVYAKKGLVYKLYLDPVAARARGIEEKVQLLSQLKHPFVVTPLGLLENGKHETVGFYMEEAPGVPLVKTFTNAWREPNGFGMPQSLKLVENMRQALEFVHRAGAITVDANEMNYLANGVEPRLLDVDSWQIGKFRASAVMPSIRDPHAKAFDENSDWYAWAVVTFQVLTGIHPYKGSHPGFKRGDMLARMVANVSVLDPAVCVNSGVREFTDIPPHLLDWYRAVFQSGHRGAPPGVLSKPAGAVKPARAKASKIAVQAAGVGLTHEVVAALPGTLKMLLPGGFVLLEDHGVLSLFDLQRKTALEAPDKGMLQKLLQAQCAVVRTESGVVLADLGAAGLTAHLLRSARDPVPLGAPSARVLPLSAHELRSWDGRLFAINRDSERGLSEIQIDVLGALPLLSVRDSWPYLAKAARALSNMATFDALGLPYLVIPKGAAVHVERCPALRGHEVLDGLALSSQRVDLLVLRRSDGQTYRLRLQRGVDGSFAVEGEALTDLVQLNGAVSEAGIYLTHGESGDLLVSSVASGASKTLAGTGLDAAAPLFALPSGFHVIANRQFVRISMTR